MDDLDLINGLSPHRNRGEYYYKINIYVLSVLMVCADLVIIASWGLSPLKSQLSGDEIPVEVPVFWGILGRAWIEMRRDAAALRLRPLTPPFGSLHSLQVWQIASLTSLGNDKRKRDKQLYESQRQ